MSLHPRLERFLVWADWKHFVRPISEKEWRELDIALQAWMYFQRRVVRGIA